uniref:Uncharacterized protein n=1 Tax=Aegilops tauschii subsp. strangulata TaxID=200361 RepID=A0A453BCK4_AEGTS
EIIWNLALMAPTAFQASSLAGGAWPRTHANPWSAYTCRDSIDRMVTPLPTPTDPTAMAYYRHARKPDYARGHGTELNLPEVVVVRPERARRRPRLGLGRRRLPFRLALGLSGIGLGGGHRSVLGDGDQRRLPRRRSRRGPPPPLLRSGHRRHRHRNRLRCHRRRGRCPASAPHEREQLHRFLLVLWRYERELFLAPAATTEAFS